MNLRLVKISESYKKQLFDMMDEWYASGEKIVPYIVRKYDYHEFDAFVHALNVEAVQGVDGRVPSTTLFGFDEERNIFVGVVDIRHYLNDDLLVTGGHIGDGVRPSERRKGYATGMIALALEECREMGLERVLMTCDKDNIASAKSIIKNGGVLENEVEHNGVMVQRYWITL